MNDAKIVPLRPDPEDGPHLSGEAMCLACQHKWISVAPVGETNLTCPACKLNRGEFVGNCAYDGDHYTCKCGCSLFRITPMAIYCPRCGQKHRPFDEPERRA